VSGVLIDLHIPGSGNPGDFAPLHPQCGAVNQPAVQYVLAAKWAAEVINNQSVSQGIKFGKCYVQRHTWRSDCANAWSAVTRWTNRSSVHCL